MKLRLLKFLMLVTLKGADIFMGLHMKLGHKFFELKTGEKL